MKSQKLEKIPSFVCRLLQK